MTVSATEEIYDPTRQVSYSSISTHRYCPQQWAYRYLSGLDTVEDYSPARDFGQWWHALKAADSIHRGTLLGTLKFSPPKIKLVEASASGMDLFLVRAEDEDLLYRYHVERDGEELGNTFSITTAHVLALAKRYTLTMSEDRRDLWREVYGGTLEERLEHVWRAYQERWDEDRDNEQPIAVEVKVKTPLFADGRMFKGYVDEVYYDTRRHLVVARDHKSGKTLPAAEALDDLMDSQLHLYAWGITDTLAEMGVGPVQALAYDRVRVGAPKTPQITAAGALSKSITDYDLDTYLRWAQGPDGNGVPWGAEGEYIKTGRNAGKPKFGLYALDPAVVDALSAEAKRNVWQQRTLVPINQHVIGAHLRAAQDEAEEMTRTKARYEKDGNATRRLGRQHCKFCPFALLCRAQMLGGNAIQTEDLGEYGLAHRTPEENS